MLDQSELELLNHQMAYEAALDGLREINPDSVDLENSFDQLQSIKNPSPTEARGVLDLAARRSVLWVGMVDTDVILFGLSPSLESYRADVKSQNNPQVQTEYNQIVTQIAAGIVRAQPESLARLMQFGYFEDDGVVMTNVLSELLPVYQQRGIIWDEARDVGMLAVMLSQVVDANNPDLITQLQPALPTRLLYFEPESLRLFPQVKQVLEQTWETNQQKYSELANTYAFLVGDARDTFAERVLSGEFGDPVEVFISCVTSLTSAEDDPNRDSAAAHLWPELLEVDRSDPRIKPLRERLMSREWYWDESKIYTLVETITGLEGEDNVADIKAFMGRYAETIAQILRKSYAWKKYGEGVERTISRGEFPAKLAAIVEEILETSRGNLNDPYVAEFSDGLLLAALS